MSKPVKLYKLTDADGRTRGGTQWGPGVTHEAKGSADQPLCSNGWIHAYTAPLLAVLLNPLGANFTNPRLWLARGIVGKSDYDLKVGCRKLTTVRELKLPRVTTTQRVAFGILCSLAVPQSAEYKTWAENWLSGKDRSEAAAWAVQSASASAEVAWAEAAAQSAAARSAWAATKPIDLISIAKAAMKVK